MARKQLLSFFGWEVDIVWWPVAAKPHLKLRLTFNKSVAQVQLNRRKYTLSHHRRTRREYCRKLVSCRCTATLQKTRRITESHSGIPRCMELCTVYAFIFIWNQASSRLPWNSMCTMLFSNARTAQMLLLKGIGTPNKQAPKLRPCMQARIRPAKFEKAYPRLPSLPELNQIACSGVKLALA